jgi:hypothetical protein
MRRSLALVSILALLGCGGGSSSTSSGTGTGTGTGSGSETPVVAGEDEGFEDDGFTESEPQIDHGTQSAHELIGVHPPPTPFDDMSDEDQEMYMVGTVLPISAESFRHYDAERFAQFECANCHGDDAAERHYEMPSRSLPPLAAPGSPQWQHMAEGPAYTFMNDIVLPETATMLGMERRDATHPDGFSCFSCHPHAGS